VPHPFSARLRALMVAGTVLSLAPSLAGCILAAAGAGAAGGYSVFGQELSPEQQIKDKAIRAVVLQEWDKVTPELAHDLSVTVYDGRVLLTGRVPKEEWHDAAVKGAWRADGVKEVYNEITVGPDTHFMDDARDTVISSRLRGDLVADGHVKSINITVKTEDGVVYVIGSARSQEELDRVTNYARNIPNVRRVVSYVRIRAGAPPVAQTTGAAGPVTTSAAAPVPVADDTAASGPTPRAAIEVTPIK
jgi:osmotically-inducible protein OsmY